MELQRVQLPQRHHPRRYNKIMKKIFFILSALAASSPLFALAAGTVTINPNLKAGVNAVFRTPRSTSFYGQVVSSAFACGRSKESWNIAVLTVFAMSAGVLSQPAPRACKIQTARCGSPFAFSPYNPQPCAGKKILSYERVHEPCRLEVFPGKAP